MSYTKFKTQVFAYYRAHGRHTLPWRRTRNPYRILVSEVMLQQTQVERVIPYYKNFIRIYPNVRALANAPLSSVLVVWQGLGYNRRAKMLHEAAQQVMKEHNGKFPKEVRVLESLRGVGPYTARAVAAFAYNQDVIFIETNIRTAVIHHFFQGKKKIRDADIGKVLERVFPSGRAREWYSALMDYGSHLKRSGVRTNHRIQGYAKQTAFNGSLRQARGAVLRALLTGSRSTAFLMSLLGPRREAHMKLALAGLTKEGMVEVSKGKYRLPV